MENGLGRVDSLNLEDTTVENEIINSFIEEKAKVGSHESKNLEGGKNFKDSITAGIQSVPTEDVIISPVDNTTSTENLASAVHKKTDSEIDFEQFEEAIEVPVDVEHQEEQLAIQPVDEPRVEEMNNEEGTMEINKEEVENGISGHEKTDNGIDFEQFEEAAEIPLDFDNQEEQSTSIEDAREIFVGVKPGDKPLVEEVSNGEGLIESSMENKLDEVENDVFAYKKTDSETDYEKFEEAIQDTTEVFDVEKNGEDESDIENDVTVINKKDEVIEISDIISTVDDGEETKKEEVVMEVDNDAVCDKEVQEDAIVEKRKNGINDNEGSKQTLAREFLDNGHVGVEKISVKEIPKAAQIDSDSSQAAEFVESFNPAEMGEEQEEILSSLDNDHEDKKICEYEEDAAFGSRTDMVEEANDKSIALNTELEDEKSSGEATEKKVEIPNSLHEIDTNEEMKNCDQLKRDLATPIPDHHLTNGKPESNIEERELTQEVKKLPVFDSLVVKRVEKAQENASKKDVERADADKSVQTPNDDTKKEETLGAKVEATEQITQTQNGAREIKHTTNAITNSPHLPAVESPNADPKKDEIVGAKVGAKVEADKKNTQERNGPSEATTKTNLFANPTTPPARPAGLGRAAPLFETAPRVVSNVASVSNRVNGTSSHTQNQIVDDLPNGEAEENNETREKLQSIRVKFLRLAHRLGQTPHNAVVAQVLYRLGLAEQLRGRNGGRVAGYDRASAMAEQLEANDQEPLDFSCTIMVLGKSGVGKSATINSIFDEVKFSTDAFQHGTKKVQDVIGTVQGIKVRVIDTPGLLPSWSDQRQNEKILLSVKRFIKRTPPDIVLYLDRLDMQTRDSGDMQLLRTITDVFGPSIWFNAIVVLTHAASAPPEGANGTATSYDMFVTNRSHVVQQAIRQAVGDMRLMNPVSLVENHSACRKNRAGQRVLPNGQVWKPHLLLLSFASKILAEANTLLKLQDSPPGRPFARTRAPPLPFLLSSLLQSRPALNLPEEQFGDDDALDEDSGESSDSEDERELDELPTFKRLTREQIGKLSKSQKKAYYEELEYREKLFMKKQLKDEKKRRRMMKKMAKMAKETPNEYNDEEESGGAASVPVPMPDLPLPASFDSDNPTHRYRYLESQWVVRPVLDSHGWDHDVGYEGVNVEKLFVVKEKIPISFSGQITKDKKDANMQMEIGSSIKHGEGKSSSLGLDMQSLGKDMAYTLRGESKFMTFKKNKASVGLSVTKLGDTVSSGIKIEDQLVLNKRLRLVASGGAMTGRGDMAYGGSFEATLRDKDHPLGRSLSTLGLSVMDWHGDLAIGWNIQSQIPVGRTTNLIARANLNNKGTGQVSFRLNSSEQLQIVLVALIPLIQKALSHLQLGQ